jgi:hypothetical protein
MVSNSISNDVFDFIVARLASLGDLSLKEAEVRLAEQLGVSDLQLQDSNQHPIHGRTLFRNALEIAANAQITLPLQPRSSLPQLAGDVVASPPRLPNGTATASAGSDADTRPLAASAPAEVNEEALIREFDRLERKKGPIWAGFIVNDFLPGLGLGRAESKGFLTRLEIRGLVLVIKQPNPKDPSHPTSYIRLNRENAAVKAALSLQAADRSPRFNPIKIAGGPLSDDIIRDRR